MTVDQKVINETIHAKAGSFFEIKNLIFKQILY